MSSTHNRLALGTVQFGLPYGVTNRAGQVSVVDVKMILHSARQHGITLLDTAMAYGDSETVLGNVGTQEFAVVTKLPPIPDQTGNPASWVRGQVEGSLSRLGRKSLYGLLIHQASQLQGKFGGVLAKELTALRQEGIVKKIGVSVYGPCELEAATLAMNLDLVQAPFNIIDRQLHTSGWLDRLYKKDIEVHVRSVFLQGLLLTRDKGLRIRFKRWQPIFEHWDSWLDRAQVSPIQACLAYATSFSQISKIVVGVDSAEQFNELLAYAEKPAPRDFPDIASQDSQLINPALWNQL